MPWWDLLSLPRLVPLRKMRALVLLLAVAGTCLVEAAASSNAAPLDPPGVLLTHRRQKRDWIWNQMHIDEEKNTSLPHYVGKVRLRPQGRSSVSSTRPIVMLMVGQMVTQTDCADCRCGAHGCEGNGGRGAGSGGNSGDDDEGKAVVVTVKGR